MESQTFGAGVQYGDWKGECHADDRDMAGFRDVLRKRGLIQPGEFVIGLQTWQGENMSHSVDLKPVRVTALVIRAANYEAAEKLLDQTDPLEVRTIRLDLSTVEFAGLFKRFSLAICPRGLSIVGREYVAEEDSEDPDSMIINWPAISGYVL